MYRILKGAYKITLALGKYCPPTTKSLLHSLQSYCTTGTSPRSCQSVTIVTMEVKLVTMEVKIVTMEVKIVTIEVNFLLYKCHLANAQIVETTNLMLY